jgi:hypothetical protein
MGAVIDHEVPAYGPEDLEFDEYRPKTSNEAVFMTKLAEVRSDTINHHFELPTVAPGMRLSPLHWAIYLNVPELVAKIAQYTCVNLEAKWKGGRDVIDFCVYYNKVHCFGEIIQFFTTDSEPRDLVQRMMTVSNPEYLEILLNTINPECTNDEVLSFSSGASAKHREVVQRFVAAHPDHQRNREAWKSRSQHRYMVSNTPRRDRDRSGDDVDDDQDFYQEELACYEDCDMYDPCDLGYEWDHSNSDDFY